MIYLARLHVMAQGRTYRDSCGIARALDLIGERWALLVARELLLGPKRFTDLREGLPTLSPDVLAQRLRGLERDGIVARRKLPPPAASKIYELTAWGHELEPVLLALGRWGSQAPIAAGSGGLSVDALAVALKTMFDPVPAGDTGARYQLCLDDQPFALQVTDGRLEVARGLATDPDATIETDSGTLASLLWHGQRLEEALEGGTVTLRARPAVLRTRAPPGVVKSLESRHRTSRSAARRSNLERCPTQLPRPGSSYWKTWRWPPTRSRRRWPAWARPTSSLTNAPESSWRKGCSGPCSSPTEERSGPTPSSPGDTDFRPSRSSRSRRGCSRSRSASWSATPCRPPVRPTRQSPSCRIR